MTRSLTIAFLLAATAAQAQQQPSTAIARISASFGQCIGTVEQQSDKIAELNSKIAELQKQIDDLKIKKEEK